MKNTWLVWAVFLLLAGAVGLSIQFAQKKAIQSRTAAASEKIAQKEAVREYLRMYEQWSELSAEEKANRPWGYGIYGGAEIRNRLQEDQSDRLAADLPSLETGFLHYPDELADVIYGPGWPQAVRDFKKARAVADVVQIASIFLLAGGIVVLAGGLARMLVLLVRKKSSKEGRLSASDASEPTDAAVLARKDDAEKIAVPSETPDISEAALAEKIDPPATENAPSETDRQGYFQSHRKSDPDTESSAVASRATELPMRPVTPRGVSSGKPKQDSYFGWALEETDSAELGTLMTTEPLTRGLTELTEEVSAIRQFAVQQQDQMRKLQDGYDWMIIRRFCMRIIRSIDNIDDRIAMLQSQKHEASAYLEDIRDELVFALESSGVEQFKPDQRMPFKGLEKYAEAVRERACTEDANLAGCIARVVRPGYQYLVNDDDVKIVRCAQVVLYEIKQNEQG